MNECRRRDRRGGRARNLLLRFWSEAGDREQARIRGTIRDLSGETLGAFDTEPGLFALLRRIIAGEAGPASPPPARPTDPEDPT